MVLPHPHISESGAQKQFGQRHILRLDHWTLQASAVPSSHLRRQLSLSPWPLAWQRICFPFYPQDGMMNDQRGQPTGMWHVAPGPWNVKLMLETGESSPLAGWRWRLSHTNQQLTTGLLLELSRVMEIFYFPFGVVVTSTYAKHIKPNA